MTDIKFLILFLLFLCVLNYFTNRKNKKLQDSKQDYLDKKGKEGEDDILSTLGKYKHGGYIYQNVFIPIDSNKYTEIDILLVNRYGIFVIESKNWKGKVYGEKSSKKWILDSKYDEYEMDNPYIQNEYHLKRLKEYLKLKNCKYYSIVVFGYDTDLYFEEDEKPSSVIGIRDIDNYMEEVNTSKDILTNNDISYINQKIESCINKDNDFKEKHIERIKDIKKRTV
ncbi:MAG: NERD domain-containing protein [Clostridium sp.]|uniref:nuclease-related domain-containing protein n=1 Tax=Clostridium sp. TaxID=1506 RepID=UPI0025BB43DC|nr:nuclease-related domain-containing protein [Clostridium sp.]MCF0149476.1 NERD domain-containing protein [Clostridium sp.]